MRLCLARPPIATERLSHLSMSSDLPGPTDSETASIVGARGHPRQRGSQTTADAAFARRIPDPSECLEGDICKDGCALSNVNRLSPFVRVAFDPLPGDHGDGEIEVGAFQKELTAPDEGHDIPHHFAEIFVAPAEVYEHPLREDRTTSCFFRISFTVSPTTKIGH